ncbi:MAG: rhomboid family intramembrane serine protease [Ignavibacteriales bacterium]|nr:rhomboid family intramembrane serine protease [Ignavibacteriales bacterium]
MSYYGNYYRPSGFGGFSFFPPAIKTLLISNAIVFFFTSPALFGRFTFDGAPLALWYRQYFGLMPLETGMFFPWQLVTYQFMHADFWHLFFNMFFGLWMFGMEVEHTWGTKKFSVFYLTCGVVAGLCQLFLAPIFEPSLAPVVGASGAVFGVLVAFAMLFPDRYIFIYFLIPIKAKYFVMFLIVLGVMSVGGPGNVANLAHLGGAFAGYVFLLYDSGKMPFQDAVDRLSWSLNKFSTKWTSKEEHTADAKIVDFSERKVDDRTEHQRKIDEILDKISRSGYQSLSEEEKKILFEASKKLN